MNSTTITGIPEKISRSDYASLIAATGIAPNNLQSLNFLADGIHAVVFARDENGDKIIDPIAGPVRNTVYIPVGEAEADVPDAAIHAAAYAIDHGKHHGFTVSELARAAVDAAAPHFK